MLIAPRLSKRLYDHFGEELANDLAEWLNQVESTSYNDLRRTLEGFAKSVEGRFAEIDARFEKVHARFEKVDARFEKVDARLDDLQDRMNAGFKELDQKITVLTTHVDRSLLSQTRWVLAAWAAQMVAIIGLYAGVYAR